MHNSDASAYDTVEYLKEFIMMYKNQELKEYRYEGKRKSPTNFKDLTEKLFGDWFVICRAPNKKRIICYWCECSCGTIKVVHAMSLTKGRSIMCRPCASRKCGSSRKKYYKEIPIIYWNSILAGAKRRNIKINITIDYAWDIFLKQNYKCFLSGDPISFCVSQLITEKGIRNFYRNTA